MEQRKGAKGSCHGCRGGIGEAGWLPEPDGPPSAALWAPCGLGCRAVGGGGGQWWSTLTSSTLGLSLAGADGWCLHRRSVFGGMRLWEDGPAPIYPWSLPTGGRGHFADG